MKYAKLRAIARIIYHALPLSQKNKWRLRERLNPLLLSLQRSPNKAGLVRAIATIASTGSRNSLLTRNHGRERALASILGDLAAHTYKFGPASHWIALPFLSMGGAERVALNLCKALLEINPGHSVVMLITDRRLINEQMLLPEKVAVIVFDNYLGEGLDYPSKQALLRDLLMAVRPYCLHNINSEVAWHLILAEGERLKKVVKLFASIFAFQFAPDGKTKTGYAAYFLKKSVPHLSGLISDNWRFVNDAIKEYHIAEPLLSNMRVVYQPCRLVDPQNEFPFHMPPFQIRVGRMQVLWAGRLDIEKRIDLFFEIVRHCDFADFHVFGQVVVDKDSTLPLMPNLSYHGPFATPLQWIEKHRFDAFLFTSKWEGMPNILIEAGALGIPTIAPTVGGVAELISEQTGYPLSENPSKNDYAVALNDISTHPEKAKKRAENLRELIKHRHSWLSFVATVASLPGYTEAPDPDLVEVTLANKTQEEIKSDIPLVSIIIPCFNQGRYLHECVASALASCHANIEIIVIDDGSTDSRTANYLADVTQMAPDIVRTHIQRNRGLSGARNSGLALARGEFIQFLDADDVLVPGKIDAQLAQLITNPRIDVSICNFLLCDETRSVFSKPDEAIAQFDLTLEDFLYRWERGFSVPIHCGLFRRRAIKDLYFDIHARAKEDWIFWTSLSLREARFGYINGHWAIYRQHNSSMRRSYLDMGRAWLQAGLRIEAMLGVREPLFFESVVAWFDLCYRSNPQYREEVAALQQRALTDEKDMTAKDESGLATSVIESDINVEKLVARLGLTCQTTKSPLISVIVPIYGHYEYLEACFESIAEQGDLPLEIILVDDASPDPRVTQLLGALKDRFDRLKVIIQPQNCGISSVQNSAVSIATGKYLAFLDCDDALEPGALSIIIEQINIQPEVDYFFTDRSDIDEEGKLIRAAQYGGYNNLKFRSKENIRMDLLDGMVASHLKVIRRSTYLKVGGCNEKLSGIQDWDLALKIAEEGNLCYVNKNLYRHRIHRNSVTSNDKVTQFRKSNILRRHYCERWLSGALLEQNRTNKRFSKADFPIKLTTLKNEWKRGHRCIADATGSLSVGQANFLREFNSYFDLIEWDDPALPASLIGYLWSTHLIDHGRD